MECPVRLHVKCTWRRYTCTWHNGQRRCTAADASIHAPSRLRTHIETCLKIVYTLKNLRRRGCARSRAPPLDPPLYGMRTRALGAVHALARAALVAAGDGLAALGHSEAAPQSGQMSCGR